MPISFPHGSRRVRRLDLCDEDPRRAREMGVRWIGGYWDSVLCRYELASYHLKQTKGYEYYGRMSEIAREKGGTDGLNEFFLNLQVGGTPARGIEKILDLRTRIGCDTFVGVFSYGGMPWEEAERKVRLFAREVRPAVPVLDGEARAGVPTAAEAAARQA